MWSSVMHQTSCNILTLLTRRSSLAGIQILVTNTAIMTWLSQGKHITTWFHLHHSPQLGLLHRETVERGQAGNWTPSLWSESDRCQAGEARSSVLMLIPDKADWACPLEKQELQQPCLITLECLSMHVCCILWNVYGECACTLSIRAM